MERPKGVYLVLSGGGVRSASFSSGILHEVAAEQKLPIEIISTVSGGGYAGSAYTLFCKKADDEANGQVPQVPQAFFDQMKKNMNHLVRCACGQSEPFEPVWKDRTLLGWSLAGPFGFFTPLYLAIFGFIFLCDITWPPFGVVNIFFCGLGGTLLLSLFFSLLAFFQPPIADFFVLAAALVIWTLLNAATYLSVAFLVAMVITFFLGDFLTFVDKDTNPVMEFFWLLLAITGTFALVFIINFFVKLATEGEDKWLKFNNFLNTTLSLVRLLLGIIFSARINDTFLAGSDASGFVGFTLFVFSLFARILPHSIVKKSHTRDLVFLAVCFVYGRVLYWVANGVSGPVPVEVVYLVFNLVPFSIPKLHGFMMSSAIISLFLPIVFFSAQVFWGRYYEWRLRRAFYPPEYRNATFQDISISKVPHEYIASATTNTWESRTGPLASDHDLVYFSSKAGTNGSAALQRLRAPGPGANGQVPPFRNLETVTFWKGAKAEGALVGTVSKGMASSGAAVAQTMGKYDSRFGDLLSFFHLTGLGMGAWYFPTKNFLWSLLIEETCFLIFGIFILAGTIIELQNPFPYEQLRSSSVVLLIVIPVLFLIALLFVVPIVPEWMIFSPICRSLCLSQTHSFAHEAGQTESIYLSDGGHYENFGLVALLLRLKQMNKIEEYCDRAIIIADGSEDKKQELKELFEVLNLARRDVGCSFFPPKDARHLDIESYLLTQVQPPMINNPTGDRAFSFRVAFPSHPDAYIPIHYLRPSRNSTKGATLGFNKCCMKFPYHTTGFQFFTQTMYQAYFDEGKDAFNAAFPRSLNPATSRSREPMGIEQF